MGPSISKSTNVISNSLKASMDSVLESQVNGDLNVSCKNQQLVEGARGCQITFADQICKAVGISNMTSNTSLDAQITQDIMNEISSKASASVEGLSLQLASVSSSSNVVMNEVDMAMNTNMSFNTSCTRNLSAINEQTVRDCENSTIQFAAQDVSGEVIGDCVANQVGSLQAAQSLTNTLDLEAEAQTKGIDMWAMVMLMAGFFLIFILGIPMFMFGMRYAATARTQNPPIDPSAKGRFRAVMLLMFGMLLVALIWWPGAFSIYLGIAPWSYLTAGTIGDNCDSGGNCRPVACALGSSVDQDLIVNRFMWYDPHCASYSATTFENPRGENTNPYCNTEEKMKHYPNCGLFASSFGCDDPQFLTDKSDYIQILEACGDSAIAGATFKTCSTGDIAVDMFAEDEDSYGDCHKCVGTSDAEKAMLNPRENYGLWAAKGMSCASGISKTAYIRGDDPCSADDPDCKENAEDFIDVSRNECRHTAYHQRKKRFSQAFKACQEVQKVAKLNEETNGGEMPLLVRQCPPNPFEYFTKCNAGTKECSYAATGCVCDANGLNCDCSSADPNIVASCKNDIMACCDVTSTGMYQCRDPQLQADLNVWKAADLSCQKKQEAELWLHPWGWVIPLIFYIIGFIYMAWILTRNPGVRQIVGGAWRNPTTQTTSNWIFLILGIVCILGAGWPIGILAVVNAGEAYSMYDAEFRENLKNFDDTTAMYAGYPIFAFGIALFVFGVYRMRRKPTTATTTTAAAPASAPTA